MSEKLVDYFASCLRDEIQLLTEIKDYYNTHEDFFGRRIIAETQGSLKRILRRFEEGDEIFLKYDSKGDASLSYNTTDKHIVARNPEYAEAKSQLETYRKLSS